MTTPNKCPTGHYGTPGCAPLDPEGDCVVCDDCGARWVPSDVLEEARRACLAIKALEGVELEFPEGTGWQQMRDAATYAHRALARIDAVLGEK